MQGWTQHRDAVATLRASWEAIPSGQPVRLAKKTSNLFRPRSQSTGPGLDVSGLDGVISIDPGARTADVQGMCTYERLVDETLAQLLVAEGFGELEEVAYVGIDELASIEGFDDELAQELQSRATEALERREEASRVERRELGVEDDLADIPHLTEAMLVVLGKAGIKTLDDLADLATDELIAKKRQDNRRGPARSERSERAEDKGGVLGEYGLSEEQGNEIIMAARAHWFDDEPQAAPAAEPQNGEAADADPAQ